MPSRGVRETCGFLGDETVGSLYVRLHEPPDGPSRPPVVIVPADGEERTWSQRTMVNLARHLASAGHPVVRFDYRGQGESDGAFEDADVPSRMEDLARAAGLARRGYGARPILVGLRLGANLAARFAATSASDTHGVIAIEPVSSMPAYVTDLLRRNLATQLVAHKKIVANRKQLLEEIRSGRPVNCNGFLLAQRFLASLDLLEGVVPPSGASGLTIIRLAGTASDGRIVDGVAPVWIEGSTFRSHPDKLFRVVEEATAGYRERSLSPDSPALEPAAADGRSVITLEAGGAQIAATWHPAAGGSTGYLLLSPGPNDRAGPHGLYVRLASRLAAAGHPVLRIDAAGVGESGGNDAPRQDRPITETFKDINEGAHVPAALAGSDWLEHRGVREVVMLGLCGGASTALLSAARVEDRPTRLILMGTPVLHQGVENELVLTEEHVREELAVMRRKLLDPAALVRFLTLQSDYRVLVRILRTGAALLLKGLGANGREGSRLALHPQTNRAVLRAWERYSSRGGRATFVFAEHDRLYGLFREHFAPFVRGEGLPEGSIVLVLERTNHNVTDREAERRLTQYLVDLTQGPSPNGYDGDSPRAFHGATQ
jgi:pimeloyl-ACP methyl ester carboxylesterase